MTQGPDISFIVAAYNAQDTIAEAIRSALSSSDVAVEVIVVDDCSTDATKAVVQSLDDARVTLVAKASNGGPASSRNIGITHARGTYVAVLDSDDAVQPARASRLIRTMEESGYQAVIDGMDLVHEDGSIIETFSENRLSGLGEIALDFYLRSNIILGDQFNIGYLKPVIRRDFLLDRGILYDENLKIGEDCMLIAEILASGGRVYVEPASGYRYTVRGDSITKTLKVDHVRAMKEADLQFSRRHSLTKAAQAALRKRARAFSRAESFIRMEEAWEDGKFGRYARIVAANPRTIPFLRWKAKYLVGRLLGRSGSAV